MAPGSPFSPLWIVTFEPSEKVITVFPSESRVLFVTVIDLPSLPSLPPWPPAPDPGSPLEPLSPFLTVTLEPSEKVITVLPSVS